jgi:RNA polymerase sigma-70 factor (ECF subfamily)
MSALAPILSLRASKRAPTCGPDEVNEDSRAEDDSCSCWTLPDTPHWIMPPKASTDRDRFGRVAEENLDAAWRVARRCGVPVDQVDDVVQEVFIVVGRRLADISRDRERAFVVGTAVRVSANWKRSRRRRPESALDDDGDTEELSYEASQEALTARRQGIELLQAVLRCMTEPQREVFVLTELEQLTAREVAEQLGIAEAAAVSRLRRARETFQLFCESWQNADSISADATGVKYDA